jgi:hypothetical protein
MTADIVSIAPTLPEDCPLTREAVWEVNYGSDDDCVLCGARPETHQIDHPDWTLERFRMKRAADWR